MPSGERIRTEVLSLRLVDWECAAIRDAARAAGQTVSEYMRRIALADAQRRLTGAATDADAR